MGSTLSDWEGQRRLIAKAIHHPGTLLDVGCANGLLLRCLLDWSPHPLVPYGIDPDPQRLDAARGLLPEYASHLAPIGLGELRRLSDYALPTRFDFVYWNVWDDLEFEQPWAQRYLDEALGATASRLILGFYGPSLEAIEKKLAWLRKKLGEPAGRTENLPATVVVVWWVDTPTAKARGILGSLPPAHHA